MPDSSMRLILASASPRRAELLRAAGFAFDVAVTNVDESIRAGESPQTYVRRLAAEKSAAAPNVVARAALQEIVILGADTAVVVDDDILGKPRDDEDAAAMLRRLSGRRHDVMTGISLRSGAYEVGRVEITSVEFARLTEDDIEWYVRSGEGRDKAGAYAIQGLASRFIPRIEGSYSNVVGLPVACVAELLREISSTRRARSSPNRSAAD
ncbi:MAG: septum formation protein Maf [Acidobacteria bacterium 13_1_40CM_2_64_6]|nr:MAG: septum formation protein Maf [Acidobacteria bacterium 13_1_40CM_65_14]OLD53699.1 MAG: septum formation protein Maf [Acidobacteria bacterium 13_1_40CM_2_64_6]